MSLHESFRSLCEHLRAEGHTTNLQQHLKTLAADAVPEEYRKAFEFWASLAGPSRNLFFDVAHGRRLNKKFAGAQKARVPLRPFNRLSRVP